MNRIQVGSPVILISFSPTDEGIVRFTNVKAASASSVSVDGITFPTSLPAWSVPEEGSGGFVRHYLEVDSEETRKKYLLPAA